MITLIHLEDKYTVYQVADYEDIPSEIFESSFCSVTKTDEEVSIVTNCSSRFDNIKSSDGWRGFRVKGILDFSLVGIINEITGPLKENKIPVFVISTFNTDYVFVKDGSLQDAIEAFKITGGIEVQDQ